MSQFKQLISRWLGFKNRPESGEEKVLSAPVRRRNFQNLSPAESSLSPPEPGPQERRVSKTARKRPAAKKSKAALQVSSETVSVVLRRQVPIRFDEEARSWLGGLPRLPVGTEWPRTKSKMPLHFVAQVDCGSFPQDLWGGLGPRAGWLLLFVDFEAIDEQKKRPIARVLHVTETGPEAEAPAGLYFARRDLADVSRLPGGLPNAQRRHFRGWPVDLLTTDANTSDLTGNELYAAPENDLALGAPDSIAVTRPITWRGAYAILAGLVLKHDAGKFESDWVGNGGLLDYPEPDASGFNKDWAERRQRLPEWNQPPLFMEADARLKAQMYEERREGWTQRAFKVLEEELAKSVALLDDYRAKVAAAVSEHDTDKANTLQQSVDYFEKQVADMHAHRAYLKELFAQYPSEQAFTAEIQKVGRAHVDWALRTQNQLCEILDKVATSDLDAPIAPEEWDNIAAQIAGMKSVCWKKTFDTQLLREEETGISLRSDNVLREEMLDHYASVGPPARALDAGLVADLEPRLRHLECGRPHKMGGLIDSLLNEPMEDGHLLLFQMASDEATGWIFGDLGLLYVSIDSSDLAAGSFDKVEAWLEP